MRILLHVKEWFTEVAAFGPGRLIIGDRAKIVEVVRQQMREGGETEKCGLSSEPPESIDYLQWANTFV